MKKRAISLFLAIMMCLGLAAPAFAVGYTDGQLCDMVRMYYKDKYPNSNPQHIAADHETDGVVSIHIYDIVEDHTATYDWYDIDRNTGKGTSILGDVIDLTPYAELAEVDNDDPANRPDGTGTPSVLALPTVSVVLVNGETVQFDAYNIGGANYFKLRDLAYALNGTQKQFAVEWNASANAISLISGQSYEPVGGEMSAGSGATQTPVRTTSKILLNGAAVSMDAYNIGGNNYFKLRDVGVALNFGVDWDAGANTVIINTSKGYTPVVS